MIDLNEVLSSRIVPGLEMITEPMADGLAIAVTVKRGTVIEKPVQMCFGLRQEAGVQKINIAVNVEERAKISILAHCVFPNARDVKHLMDADIRVGEHAQYTYFERHVHGDHGGILVAPRSRVTLDRGARFKTDFELIRGRAGTIDMDYQTTCAAQSVMEMTTRISGKADDAIKIREVGHLAGEGARGVLTSRVAVKDQATAEVYSKLTATAAHARGHVDCKEIVQGKASANAVPIVQVQHPQAHVTHEAAVGSVDAKQLETLMARGLSEDEASDVIIEGLLT